MSALVSGNWLRNNWLENMFREVLDAKWDQIDFDQRSWRIPKTKSGKVRHVPLSEHALQTLASVRKIYGPMHFEYIFANPKTGLPFVSIFVGWNAARKRAGLSTTRIHDPLRPLE